ncbi:uncharacterized protein J3D65DRAFT_691871 [Phyllosticta citribraziliensis]|uniref:Uncharacterized protein n=1 Tax=Phyllosticta citribraziliensis TaxID=989973 RepID=A0ABR1M027_9PEZI
MGSFRKKIYNLCRAMVGGTNYKKLTTVTVGPGITALPKGETKLLQWGIRLDFSREVDVDGVIHNEFKLQPNRGKIADFLARWRQHRGGTHAVIATIRVKKNGTKDDVLKGIEEGLDEMDEDEE